MLNKKWKKNYIQITIISESLPSEKAQEEAREKRQKRKMKLKHTAEKKGFYNSQEPVIRVKKTVNIFKGGQRLNPGPHPLKS